MCTKGMNEVIQIAAALGVSIDSQIVDRFLGISRGTGHYQTSMRIDRRHGRPMEIEAIIAAPLRVARHHHVQTPLLAMLDELLLSIEQARVR